MNPEQRWRWFSLQIVKQSTSERAVRGCVCACRVLSGITAGASMRYAILKMI